MPILNKVTDDPEVGTRYKLTLYLLGAVLIIVLFVMGLSAVKVPVPDFVSGVVVMGFMTMLKGAYDSYFKAREEIQQAKSDIAKLEAGKPPA